MTKGEWESLKDVEKGEKKGAEGKKTTNYWTHQTEFLHRWSVGVVYIYII